VRIEAREIDPRRVERLDEFSSPSVTGQPSKTPGNASSGAANPTTASDLPSFVISARFSSTRISLPLSITPMRSAISSASSI
jgi:hypothetical protein